MRKRLSPKVIILLAVVFPVTFTFQSCDDAEKIMKLLSSLIDSTGWLMDDESMNDIPEDITPFDDNTAELKTKVDLSSKFPPIGDQGRYGTCITWAVGYNLKTALNGIEQGWSANDLANTANQTSPRDLWYAIPSSSKGSNCEGTNFEPAMDALISKGAKSLSEVPYPKTIDCNGTTSGSSSNKLANYRKIAASSQLTKTKSSGLTAENFKGYLSAGRPIAIGAKLGDRFMTWDSDNVIDYDTYLKDGMQHAYHAMVLVGYDDSKGAFRVRNSWGPSWGDNGSIWVDYDFFLDEFCFAAFVAQNTNNSISFGSDGSIKDLSSGYDLMAYFAEDYNNSDSEVPTDRCFSYEVYNSGNKTVESKQSWSIVYMYYDATNANAYELIYEDYYVNWGNPGDMGEYNETDAIAGGFWNNFKVEPGKMIGEEELGEGEVFEISYSMPKDVTGKYYLVVMADAYDDIDEVNEDNNFYFITAENGKPLEFKNGVVQNMPKTAATKRLSKGKQPKQYADTETQAVTKLGGNPNAYTPQEIKTLLLHDKKTGKLDQKIKEFRSKGENKQTVKKKISK